MYKQFYGLSRNPFEIIPDPHFYCPTPFHNEALACLLYGIERRKGFVVVTGEVGTGKTLLVQCLLRTLSRNQTAFSHVFNPRLSVHEFLQYVISDLGLPTTGKNKSELLIQLNNFLIARFQRGTTTALIIDEGHLLDWEVLEEIRLLTNLETVQQKLLQIILIGQPELDEKLDSADLRQLKQRVAFRCNLKPLSEMQVKTYILRRLELAGANSHAHDFFSDATLARINHYSNGIPRLINTICENALIAGYARQLRNITPEVIEQVATDFRLNLTSDAGKRRPAGKQTEIEELLRIMRILQIEKQSNESSLSNFAARGAKE